MDGVDGDGVTIRIDQGLNTSDISPSNTLDAFLKETRYVIQIDNRLGSILPPSSTATATATPAAFNFLDDDNIAHYTFTLGTDSDFVTDRSGASDLVGAGTGETLEGPRGTTLKFKIKASPRRAPARTSPKRTSPPSSAQKRRNAYMPAR